MTSKTEGFSEEQRAMLAAALDPAYVKTRRGPKGRTLSYVEGWRVIAEANRIFGFEGWDLTIEEVRLLREGEGLDGDGNKVWTTAYMAKVRVTVWAGETEVVHEGLGFGDGAAPLGRPGEAHEGALKEAETDAMKRAFRYFGSSMGLDLYDKDRDKVPANANTQARQSDSAKLDAIEGACSPSVRARADKGRNLASAASTASAAGGPPVRPPDQVRGRPGAGRVYYLTWSGRNVRGTDPIEVGTAAARALAAAAGEGRLDECWRRAVLPLVRRLAADGHTRAANGLRRRYEELAAA